ncbi:MAG: hypothetical protein K6L76_06425 [Agarilytica sp.]
MNVKSILLSGFLAASSTAFAAPVTYIQSTPSLDGDVNSSWAVDIFSDELTIGNTGTLIPNNHKAIVTFDTTQITAGETVDAAHAVLSFSEFPEGMQYGDLIEYLADNIKIEIASPYGFGGSHAITAYDYYSLPVATVDNDDIDLGWYVDLGFELTDYVNPFGLTQVSISLINNPQNIAIKFKSGEVEAPYISYHESPIMIVSYK